MQAKKTKEEWEGEMGEIERKAEGEGQDRRGFFCDFAWARLLESTMHACVVSICACFTTMPFQEELHIAADTKIIYLSA